MGRTPRLVNPDDGPLQAFAHDLRELRARAGNPTYRALARTAGFSASTLGEAAGGVNRPSLDVTLAFVGACGGDVEAWQERWYQLDRHLTAEQLRRAARAEQIDRDAPADARDDSPAAIGPAAEQASDETDIPDMPIAAEATDTGSEIASPPTTSAERPAGLVLPPPGELDAPPPPRSPAPRPRRVRRALTAAAALAAVSVVAFFGVRWTTGDSNASNQGSASPGVSTAVSASASNCVVPGPKGLFSGATRASGARIRAGASMADNTVRTIAPYCGLEFNGYCLGDVVTDAMGGTPDMRWFEVSGGGVVSSAVIHGNPPAGMKPSACPDSVPPPSSIALSVTDSQDSSGALELHATGVHVWIVGFATVPEDRTGGPVPASAKWQQIGMVGPTPSGFTLAWSARASNATPRPTGIRSPAAGGTPADRVPIVAVACYGGQGPTDVMDAESISVTKPGDATPLTLTTAQRAAAADSACGYPRP